MPKHLRHSSGDYSQDVQLQVLRPEEADSVGHDMKHGSRISSSLRRKKSLACVVLLFLVLIAFAVMLFLVFAGLNQTREDLNHLERRVEKGEGGGSTTVNTIFVSSICGVPSSERYLLVTVNYDGINDTDPSTGSPFVSTDELPPGFVAVIDTDPNSKSYSSMVSQVKLAVKGGRSSRQPRRGTQYSHYFVLGDAYPEYSDIYVVDIEDPTDASLHTVINGTASRLKYALGAPGTIRTLPDGTLLVAMMGSANPNGGGKGGFLQLDPEHDFRVKARWDSNSSGQDPLNDQRKANYDFWMVPYVQNTLVSSEWLPARSQGGAGSATADITAIPDSQSFINFWNMKLQSIEYRVDLRTVSSSSLNAPHRELRAHLQPGYMPLEVRMLHKQQALGYVAVAGNGEVVAFWRVFSAWETEAVIQVDPKLDESNPNNKNGAIPALITDMIVSADDSRLYLANWAHGEIRQYDISNPIQPVLCSTLQVSSGYNKMHGPYSSFHNEAADKDVYGGPARLQLRSDGTQLFFTTSFVPGWDNDFYPEMTKKGSFLGKVLIDTCTCSGSSMKLDPSFGVDFGDSKKFPDNSHSLPARAHDLHFVGGDPSTYPSQFISSSS